MSRYSKRLERLLNKLSDGEGVSRGAGRLVREEMRKEGSLRDLLDGHEVEDLERLFAELNALPRVRPILVSLAARAAGAKATDRELQYSAELLHLALVVHDVTLGRQGGRRRRLARRVVRRSVGLMGGESFTLRALELARHTSSPEILGELVETLREMSDGQRLTEEFRAGRGLANSEEYFQHADSHTGALLAFCCRGGAHLAGGDIATLTALGRYGRHVGRIWNVADDVMQLSSETQLSYLVDRARTGRPVLPASIAGERDSEAHLSWEALVERPSKPRARRVMAHIHETGAISAGGQRVAKEAWAARKALRSVPPSDYREALDTLVSGMAREVLLVA
jgi:octaprenyl-diphosphate synthase